MHYITLYYLLQHGAIVDTANTMRHTKLWENMALSTKLKYTMCCIRRQPATATVDLHRKFGKVWHIVFEICEQTEKDIQRHTDRLITTLHTHPGGEVMKCRHMQVRSLQIVAQQLNLFQTAGPVSWWYYQCYWHWHARASQQCSSAGY